MVFPQYSKRKLDKINRIFEKKQLRFICCGLCGQDDHKNIFEEMGFSIVKCNRCGFIYTNPVPDEVHLSVSEEELQKDIQEVDQKRFVYQGILKGLGRFKKSGVLLDIGCGMGYFLRLAKKADYQPIGIDLNRSRVTYLQQNTPFDVRYGSLEDTGFEPDSFDVVTLLEVLEHVANPTGLLKQCHRVLKDDGILVIEVPNVTFQLAKARFLKMVSRWTGKKYYGVMPFMHLVHFNTQTLNKLVGKCGFRLICSEPRGYYASPGDSAVIKFSRYLYSCVIRFLCSVSRFNADTALVAYAMKAGA